MPRIAHSGNSEEKKPGGELQALREAYRRKKRVYVAEGQRQRSLYTLQDISILKTLYPITRIFRYVFVVCLVFAFSVTYDVRLWYVWSVADTILIPFHFVQKGMIIYWN